MGLDLIPDHLQVPQPLTPGLQVTLDLLHSLADKSGTEETSGTLALSPLQRGGKGTVPSAPGYAYSEELGVEALHAQTWF